MKSPKKEGILLESGTNEIEIMKFRINDELYGINVAKVKEIMMAEHAKPMPHSHPSVEGFFKPRESLITVVNLTHYLTGEMKPHGDRDLFIITNFNKIMVAFRVDSIDGISRISSSNRYRAVRGQARDDSRFREDHRRDRTGDDDPDVRDR